MSPYTGGGGYLPLTWWLAGAAVDLDIQNNRYYDSGAGGDGQAITTYLSCSRASTAYAETSAGVLASFAIDTLRITDLGLLIEDARTNLFLDSEDFNTANNTVPFNLIIVTENASTAPDATTTADRMVPTTDNENHRTLQTVSAASNGAYTFSIYIKPAGYNFVRLDMSDNTTGDALARFDLSTTGVVDSTSVDGSWTSPSGVVEQLGYGWFRCSLTATKGAGSDILAQVYLYDTLAHLQANSAITGNGTSGFYFWGGQVEQASFVSSYIPTTSASVTRAADSISIISTANTLINASTGTIVGRIGNTEGSSFAANLVDSNGTNCLGFNASNNALASISATLATSNTANRSSSTDDKLALGWQASARSLCLNGGTVATDTTSQTPSATQKLGSASGSSNFIYAYVRRLTLWNSKLANATLQGFTTL